MDVSIILCPLLLIALRELIRHRALLRQAGLVEAVEQVLFVSVILPFEPTAPDREEWHDRFGGREVGAHLLNAVEMAKPGGG